MVEPILVAIAAALAGKSVGNLYELVRGKLAGRKGGVAVLEAAKGAPAESPEVEALAQELQEASVKDPEFGAALRAHWAQARDGGVVNQVSGTVQGNVVQARDIKGDITFK